ncbi:MAG: class I SAM-dependent rRNA methyltransferase [Cyclobacteriaceae bacterium]
MMQKKIFLKPHKSQSIERRHPWIFSGAIQKKEGNPQEGDIVAVYDQRQRFLGSGHFQEESISVRILTFKEQEIDAAFWQEKIQKAWASRRLLGLPSSSTNAFRLVHGEGDGLSGLIVDLYGNTAVIQTHSLGMYHARHKLAEAIIALPDAGIQQVYLKVHKQLQSKFPQASDEWLLGKNPGTLEVKEYDVRFLIDVVEGQKTGFFLDQRENRALLGSMSKGKKVLNTFAYTGGFSLFALQGGAQLVHSVDVSARAMEVCQENVRLNGYENNQHQGFTEDTFRFLAQTEETYDIIVLDPPAFAKHRNARHSAVRGYQKLNAEALRKLPAGGLLFTFSCSQVVDTTLFNNTIRAAAIEAGRETKVLYRLSQPADHPVSIFHPEGEYLKGLVLEVK